VSSAGASGCRWSVVIAMRDSKRPDGPVLIFTPAEWEAFTLGVQDGEFDLT